MKSIVLPGIGGRYENNNIFLFFGAQELFGHG
jgi:hypothetical protein